MERSFVSNSNCNIKCSDAAEQVLKNILNRRCCICGDLYQMTTLEYAFRKFGRVIHDFSIHNNYGGYDGGDDWCCPDCAEELLRIKNL